MSVLLELVHRMLTNHRCLLVAAMAVVASTLSAQDALPRLDSITADSLNRRDVVGVLGLPLGQVTEISATVVSGNSTRRKADSGTYLLDVLTVNGKKLPNSRLIHFNVAPGSHAQLAHDTFALFELKTGKKPGRIGSTEVKEIELGYVDTTVRLSVYETGGYAGIPANSKLGTAGTAFSFRTHLEILEQLDSP